MCLLFSAEARSVHVVCARHSKNLESSRLPKCALVLYMNVCVQVYFEVHILHVTYMFSIVRTVSVCVCVCAVRCRVGRSWLGATL